MKGQIIPPSVKTTIESTRTNKQIFRPNGPIGGAPAKTVLVTKTPFTLSLVIIMFCALIGVGISVDFFKTSPVPVLEYFQQAVEQAKSIMPIDRGEKSDYELIANIPEDVAQKYKEEPIYCWADERGRIHYSNIGFPLTGKYEKKWVREK
ncbi:hypothetical protein [Desulfogranum marinum]|uniref:hypothetical protein n=1 Tax=Desulfogranum marinum TaxID=453220 RepID=UPI00196459DB|nr:hypothetical protein [Desulfogranum marinum]MBM9512379.1 hypothetical protein [Desulfogranum marinum]